jgi:N-acetylneuraminate synthase
METMRAAFGLQVGLSDHTAGVAIAIAAVALGAKVIEKHVTLDRELPGPDHKASLEPDELKMMISSIRQVERALGSPVKYPTPSEVPNRSVVRKSLVAARPIACGDTFTEENLTTKRPGHGISPMLFWSMMGRAAQRSYTPDERIAT